MVHYVSEKMDGYSPERRNREITEKINLLMESEGNYQKTGDRAVTDWEAYLLVGHEDQGVPPCIWLVNDRGAGDLLEFATEDDARDTFREMQEAIEGGESE
jgi:hypothetical protein